MENFKQIDPAEITDNFIRAIGREWMLVTAGNRESCNTMTASWGLIGFIWGRPVAQFVIRPALYAGVRRSGGEGDPLVFLARISCGSRILRQSYRPYGG